MNNLPVILLPSILGYLSASLCNIKDNSGYSVNFRPKPSVFSIVWIILYMLLGLSWYYAMKESNKAIIMIFYVILNIALCSWIYFYACKNQKINGIYALIVSFILALWCYTIGNLESKLLIVPLIGWLLFATFINVAEVQKM